MNEINLVLGPWVTKEIACQLRLVVNLLVSEWDLI